MRKTFSPMLAPNEAINLREMSLPLVVSYKLDGIRCIFKDGQMLSRALKQFPNKQLNERFQAITNFCLKHNIILDGELLSQTVSFNELSGLTRQLDHELPDDLYFYCFDMIMDEEFDIAFSERVSNIDSLSLKHLKILPQYLGKTYEEIEQKFKEAIEYGHCDGLILRDPNGRYKFGRGTIKEGMIYKLKPFQTFDSRIIEVLQATKVDPHAEKKINELGYSVTSKKKEDRILIEKAAAVAVMHEGKRLEVSLAMTDEEKEEVWKHKRQYIGKWIEYKGLLIGAKDLPRHPVFIRFREDKTE